MAATVTAAAEVGTARVALTVQGGTPGDAFYLFRRDSAAVGIVRDTSLGTLEWPAYGAAVASNGVRNPELGTNATDWSASAGTGGVTGALTRLAGQARPLGRPAGEVGRVEWSTATTAVGGGLDVDTGPGAIPGAPVSRYAAVWVRSSIAQRLALIAQNRTDANVSVGSNTTGGVVVVAANTWTKLDVTWTAPATATRATLSVRAQAGTGGVVWPVGATLDGVFAQLSENATVPYFTGADTDTSALHYAWTGAAHASRSEALAYAPVVVYDYEARQGQLTDYLLATVDGETVATTSLTLPAWGTWLKSPGRPFLNTRCYLEQESAVKRPARRTVVTPEGSTESVVISEARAGRQGALRITALDSATVDAINTLLDSGLTLMLDTAPQWRSPWRYISVGDVVEERAYGDGTLSLDHPARVFAFGDVLAVEAPIGVTAVASGLTYGSLPTLFANYVAIPATREQYQDLVVG